MDTSIMESCNADPDNRAFPDVCESLEKPYDAGDHLSAIRRQLRDELRVDNRISDELRQLIRAFSVEERQVMVDRNCFALRECERTTDMEFLIEECAATISGGGFYCPLCVALRHCDVDRVSILVEYLLGKRPLKYRPDQRQRDGTFLTQLLIANLLPQPFTPEAENTADLLFFHGASLRVEVQEGTAVEWAVRFGQLDWVQYLLDKEAVPWAKPGGGRNALRLAAILREAAIYKDILLRPDVPPSGRQEAQNLWECAHLIVSSGCHESPVPAWLTTNDDGLRGINPCANLSFRPGTSERVRWIILAVGFVQTIFGNQIPPFFAHDVIQYSTTYLLRFGSTTSDIVDLLIAVIDFVDEYNFSSRYLGQEDLIRVIRASRNDLTVPHLSRLLVKYCRRQLRLVHARERLQDWPSMASTLLELALENTTCVADAIAELESTLHRAVILAVAVDLWRYRFSKTQQLEELVRQLVDCGTYVGLSGMLVYDDTPLSATRLRRGDVVGKLIHEAACCQLNYPDQCVANPPAQWRLRTLKCIAAHRLNRCLNIDQFAKLPNAVINVRGMLIPLPYMVDSHNAGFLRSQRLQRPVQPPCSCFGLGSKRIYSTF